MSKYEEFAVETGDVSVEKDVSPWFITDPQIGIYVPIDDGEASGVGKGIVLSDADLSRCGYTRKRSHKRKSKD